MRIISSITIKIERDPDLVMQFIKWQQSNNIEFVAGGNSYGEKLRGYLSRSFDAEHEDAIRGFFEHQEIKT